MRLARVLKAILGTAVTWGVAWTFVAIPLSIPMVQSLTNPYGPHLSLLQASWFAVKSTGPLAFTMGAVLGTAFALLLLLVSRRAGSLQRLSLPVIGTLGAVATAVTGGVLMGPRGALSNPSALVAVGTFVALGASVAMTSLAIARRAPNHELESPNETFRLPSA
jgi:hypothetical protein